VKKCPFCAEDIQDAAIVCKHCGRDLPVTEKTESATPEAPREAWYYGDQGKSVGPYTWADLIGLVRSGQLKPTTQINSDRDKRWQQLSDIPALSSELPTAAAKGQKPSKPKTPFTLAKGVRAKVGVGLAVVGLIMSFFVGDGIGWGFLVTMIAGRVLVRGSYALAAPFGLAVFVMIPASAYRTAQETRARDAAHAAAKAAAEERERERLEDLRKNKTAHYEAGAGHAAAQRYREALAAFALVAEVDPDYEELQKQMRTAKLHVDYQTGAAEMDAGRYANAVKSLGQVVAVDPDFKDASRRHKKAQAEAQEQAAEAQKKAAAARAGAAEAKRQAEFDANHDKNKAFIICKNYVKAALRSPSTADFPWIDYTAVHHGRGKYTVRSYVDAQNAFGATIRNTWFCTVTYRGGEWADQRNWTLDDLKLQ
jgi:tetratricopeptide (TPR) repeat protein